jgi:hypothetical protein
MSNRIPQLYQFINAQKTNLFNTYQVGSTVGFQLLIEMLYIEELV